MREQRGVCQLGKRESHVHISEPNTVYHCSLVRVCF